MDKPQTDQSVEVDKWIIFLAVGGVLAGLAWEWLSEPVARSVFVAALLFAFHDYFERVFHSLYNQALDRTEIEDFPLIASSTTASTILVIVEIAIATPLAVSSQYQITVLNLIGLSVFGTIVLGLLLYSMILQMRYIILPMWTNQTVRDRLKTIIGIYFIILTPSILHLLRYLPAQLPPLDLTTGVSLFTVILLLAVIFVVLFLIITIVFLFLAVVTYVFLPFSAPFGSSLPPVLIWWALGSLVIVYGLLIVYHWSAIVTVYNTGRLVDRN